MWKPTSRLSRSKSKMDEQQVYKSKYTAEQIDEAIGKALEGGGGEVKFYPEVITLDGYDSLAQGDTVTLEQSIDEGTYAIFLPNNGKRVLGQCVKFEAGEHEVQITQSFEYRGNALLNVGDEFTTSQTLSWGNVDDYVTIHCRTPAGDVDFGWVLARIIEKNTDYSYYKVIVVKEMPTDYDGTLTTTTINYIASTFEVITLLDKSAPSNYYQHFVQFNGNEDNNYAYGQAIFLTKFNAPLTWGNIGTLFETKEARYSSWAYWGNSDKRYVSTAILYNNPSYMGGIHVIFEGSGEIQVNESVTFNQSNAEISDTVTLL